MPTMTSFRWYLRGAREKEWESVRTKEKTGKEKGRVLNVLGLVVLEFDMETILDTDFHLDSVVRVWRHAIRVYPNIPLLDHICQPPRYRYSNVVPASNSHAVSKDR